MWQRLTEDRTEFGQVVARALQRQLDILEQFEVANLALYRELDALVADTAMGFPDDQVIAAAGQLRRHVERIRRRDLDPDFGSQCGEVGSRHLDRQVDSCKRHGIIDPPLELDRCAGNLAGQRNRETHARKQISQRPGLSGQRHGLPV